MKKAIITLALLTGAAAAHAQRSDVSLGLKAGATLSNFEGADAGAYKDIFGFHAGGFVNIGLTDMVAFQPELLYSQKGAKAQLLGGDYATTRLHYIDVPLVFHLNAGGLFFEAGPQVGFLAKAQSVYGNTTTTLTNTSLRTVDFGYVAGLGYQRKSGLGVGLRYNGGITNLRQPIVIGNNSFQSRERNGAFQLYLTYSVNGR